MRACIPTLRRPSTILQILALLVPRGEPTLVSWGESISARWLPPPLISEGPDFLWTLAAVVGEAPGCGHRPPPPPPQTLTCHSPFSTARLNLNEVEKQWRLNQLNNAATALVFITVVINVFITAFGAHKTGFLAARTSRTPL